MQNIREYSKDDIFLRIFMDKKKTQKEIISEIKKEKYVVCRILENIPKTIYFFRIFMDKKKYKKKLYQK